MPGHKGTNSSDLTTITHDMAGALTQKNHTHEKEERPKSKKQWSTQLSESEEKFRNIFDESPIGISTAGDDYHLHQVNKAYCELVGYTKEELKELSFLDITHPDDRQKNAKLAKKLLSGDISDYSLEKRYIHKSGKIVWVTLKTTLVRDRQGKPLYTLGMAEDISERKRSEELLRQSEKKFSLVFQASPLPICITEVESGVIVDANESLLRLSGYNRDEIRGQTVLALGFYPHPQDRAELMEDIVQSRSISGREMRFRIKSGEIRQLAVYIETIELQGKPCLITLFEDITERKEIENRKNEFISIASHELKTPLTSTKAFTQILKQRFAKIGDEPAARYLCKLENQVNKLTDLVNDLLDITRIEAGKLELHKELFHLEALAIETVEDLQHVAKNHQIVVEGHISKPIEADRERTAQVIVNLITNAIKYSPDSDSIVVRLTSNVDYATVSVQDFGIGIAPEKIDKVFERFFRSDNRSSPGLGLGLYIASEIIRRHEGTIGAESQIGCGSTFSFSLPYDSRHDAS